MPLKKWNADVLTRVTEDATLTIKKVITSVPRRPAKIDWHWRVQPKRGDETTGSAYTLGLAKVQAMRTLSRQLGRPATESTPKQAAARRASRGKRAPIRDVRRRATAKHRRATAKPQRKASKSR